LTELFFLNAVTCRKRSHLLGAAGPHFPVIFVYSG